MRNCQEGEKKIIKTSEETIQKQREREQKQQIKNSFAVTTQMFELHTSGNEQAIFWQSLFFPLHQAGFSFLVFEAHCLPGRLMSEGF